MLETDGQSDVVGRNSGRVLLRFGELLVRRRRGMDRERLRVADVREVREELEAVDEIRN